MEAAILAHEVHGCSNSYLHAKQANPDSLFEVHSRRAAANRGERNAMCLHAQPATKQSQVIIDLTRRISDLEHLLAQVYVCASRLGAPQRILSTIQDGYQGKPVGNVNIIFDLEDFSGRLLDRLMPFDYTLLAEEALKSAVSSKVESAIVAPVETPESEVLESSTKP